MSDGKPESEARILCQQVVAQQVASGVFTLFLLGASEEQVRALVEMAIEENKKVGQP